jgi:hypothetical protein
MFGQVYLLCWWEKKVNKKFIGNTIERIPTGLDVTGYDMVDPNIQEPAFEEREVPQYADEIVYDRFNFDVIDPRNVFTDDKYAYSAQHKDWIIIRSEKTYNDLKENEYNNGYFDLDHVKKLIKNNLSDKQVTDTTSETKGDVRKTTINTALDGIDVLERYGKFPVIVLERNENDYPISIKPGIDKEGKILDDAEYIETIITYACKDNQNVLIRFQPSPFIDAYGKAYRPLVRGWCYIHPTKDNGLSDGKFAMELQKAINDTFNMNNDRTKLATLPTLKARRNSLLDNDTIYFAPEHIIELESPDDLVEMKIDDNIQGGLSQISMLVQYMQKVTARYPSVMGEMPTGNPTATAVSETSQRGNLRNNYKSLTTEYTLLIELYWMILQLSDQFMEKQTAELMLGEFIKDFDPRPDYTYSPVTQSIEVEQNKYRKLQLIDQFLGRIVKFPNPNTTKVINYLLSKAFELFGDEFPEYKNMLMDESVSPNDDSGQGNGIEAEPTIMPNSNQNGSQMSEGEIQTRNANSEGQIG